MNPLFNNKNSLSHIWLFVAVTAILLAAYILTPRFWEPGGESFRAWVSARIFRETGGFPVFHQAPLYNIYLQLFLFLDYPLSIRLEHFVTHLFTYTCIFLLLRRFLPTIPAFLLTCAWIPTLWTVEGGARVAGMGFLALYLRTDKKTIMNKGFLPASLIAAALLGTDYIFFLVGHIIGTIVKRRSNKESLISFAHSFKYENIFPTIVKSAMILLVILTIFFQSKRPDNNVFAFNYPWMPQCSNKEILSESILQVGNWRYVMQNIPESEWIYQDWYFTNEEAFGGASNVFEAVRNNPKLFFKNILLNIPSALQIPVNFIAGFRSVLSVFNGVLIFLSWILLPIGLYRIFQYFKANDLVPHIYSVVFGTAAVIAALLLVWFPTRYVIVLLPVGLLIIAHLGAVIKYIINIVWRGDLVRPDAGYINSVDSKGRNILFIFGLLFILLGFLANEWTLTPLLSPDRSLLPSSRIGIWSLDFLSIIGGILLILKRDFFLSLFKRIKDSPYSNTQSWFAIAVILVMAVSIFSSSNPYKKKALISSLLHNPFLLSGRMTKARRQLLASVNKQTRVLALEEPWIRSFADTDLDKVFHALYLPPFKDKSGKTEEFLNSLDVIWVSDGFSSKAPSVATQGYLRYELHVAPFLKKAVRRGWTVEKVEGFGKIYRRPDSDE